jgi:hypothetical protein
MTNKSLKKKWPFVPIHQYMMLPPPQLSFGCRLNRKNLTNNIKPIFFFLFLPEQLAEKVDSKKKKKKRGELVKCVPCCCCCCFCEGYQKIRRRYPMSTCETRAGSHTDHLLRSYVRCSTLIKRKKRNESRTKESSWVQASGSVFKQKMWRRVTWSIQ